ncbi:MAG TPA: HAD hydrolase-like protein [Spirochaetota bacterium]
MNFLSEYLFLFDIDGTLLDARGDGRRAIVTSLKEVLGVDEGKPLDLKGGVDRLIFNQYFAQTGHPSENSEVLWERFCETYLAKIQSYPKENWILFPHAIDAVRYLFDYSNIGIATGNIKSGADIKLKAFGLSEYFDCGGYGDSAPNRSSLVAEAIMRAEEHHKRAFRRDKIIMLGDTEKDVSAAHDNEIIPVLIDHKGENRENAQKWNAHYHGTFAAIEQLVRHLSSGTRPKSVVYF